MAAETFKSLPFLHQGIFGDFITITACSTNVKKMPKMFPIWFLLSFLLLNTGTSKEDFKTYDYCKVKCERTPDPHSACDCTKKAPLDEVVTDPSDEEFRKIMIQQHNYWRNYVASGKENRPSPGVIPKAANMMLMSYDMELEYIAKCHALKVSGKHDNCRTRIGNLHLGQNLFGTSEKGQKDYENFETHWYGEVADVPPGTIDSYQGSSGKPIGHFTQMVWWSANLVGCARSHNPQETGWRYQVTCNYGSTVDKYAGNLMDAPVYKKGEPCSQCPNSTKCESSEYPSLCGSANRHFQWNVMFLIAEICLTQTFW